MSDFRLIQKSYIKDIGTVSLFVHKSGGRAVCVDNDDDNRVFSLCFDTPALDDTGIPHILEHCVLCGSQKYPFKDPFAMLVNSTSHTYLNAITFPHKTLFPVASRDEISLKHMAEVYCDAVFDPLVYKNKGIFLQEGGYFDGKRICGVVHSEMSGLYDDPEKAAELSLVKKFLPYHSAGVPSEIPKADYAAMLEYHKKYYTAANCFAYIYGDHDKESYLELLDGYFSKNAGKRPETPVYTMPARKVVQTDIPYDVKTAVFPLCLTCDPAMTAAFEVAVSAFKNAFPHFDISFNADGPTAYAVIHNASRSDIEKAVRELEISSADIDRLRFYISRGDFGYKPRGLFLNLKMMYGDLVFDSLEFDKIFDKIAGYDLKKLAAEAFIGNGIYGRCVPMAAPKHEYKAVYPKTEENMAEAAENTVLCKIPLPKCRADIAEISKDKKTAFTETDNRDIIYISLAFELDIPYEILKNAGALIQNYTTGLENISAELADAGRPCVVIHAGFFADREDKAAEAVNSVFHAPYTGCILRVGDAPEKYTDLVALSGIEKNALILKEAFSPAVNGFDGDISAVRKAVFSKDRMSAAVCCHSTNRSAAERVLAGIRPYEGGKRGDVVFEPDFGIKIMPADMSVNTVSMAIKPNGSRAAAFMAAEILKNTYLWDTVRNNGAYGCGGYVTPSGSLCINSFKDPNFEKTIGIFGRCGDILREIDNRDMHRYKLMCLNVIDRPKSFVQKNMYALKKMFGIEDIRSEILGLKADDVRNVFSDSRNIAAFRTENGEQAW